MPCLSADFSGFGQRASANGDQNPDQLPCDARRVGEGAEQIENGSDAHFYPRGADKAHGGMMIWGKHEADIGVADTTG
ncbi:MAG: hypothetical protein OIF58_14600, partial [Cohaesibacter sp.]|nr:hypothetical protein [Cohaesibacter sp.]